MKNNTLTAALTMSVAAVAAAALTAHAAPPKARVSPAQAEAAATKRIPGRAISAKYEFEDGHWQYGVIVIDKNKQMYEVEVNATSGKVTDTEKTSAAEESSEAAADKKAAMKTNRSSSHMQTPEKGEAGEKNEAGEAGEKGEGKG